MREEHRMVTPYRHFNTWMGDLSKALLTRTQNEVIKEDNLIDHARETGEYFKAKLQKVNPGMISDVRGRGTLLGYDVKDAEMRDNLLVTFKEFGINTAGCGTHTVRLRPSFYFGKKHVDIYIEALEKSLAKLAKK